MTDGDRLDPFLVHDDAWDRLRRADVPSGAARGTLELVHWRHMRARLDGRPLVKRLLEREQMSLIVGESGCGKTFLALDLALHVAAGRAWFGRKVSAGPVVYVAAEAGASIVNRVVAWRDHCALATRDIPFAVVPSPIDLCHSNSGDLERLIAEIHGAGFSAPALVVIDTVSRVLAGGNENGPDDMGALVRSLDRLRDALRCHVCAVHHLGKDVNRGSRGHSLLHCAVDTEITVVRDNDTEVATVTVAKQRDGPAGQTIAFRLRLVELGSDQDGDPVTSCIVEPVDTAPGANAAGRRKRLSDSEQIALRTLRKAIAEAGVPAPMSNHIPPAAHVVTVETWRRFFYAGTASDEQTAEARKKAFQRARERLQAAGMIGLHDDHCWVVADLTGMQRNPTAAGTAGHPL